MRSIEPLHIPSGYVKIAVEAMAIEIVVLPIKKMVIFHSYVSLPEGKSVDVVNHCYMKTSNLAWYPNYCYRVTESLSKIISMIPPQRPSGHCFHGNSENFPNQK